MFGQSKDKNTWTSLAHIFQAKHVQACFRLISLMSFNFYACLYKNASARQNMQHGLVAVMHHVGVFVGLVCINHIILYNSIY